MVETPNLFVALLLATLGSLRRPISSSLMLLSTVSVVCRLPAQTVSVSGVVFDSLAHTPLAFATVQMASQSDAERTHGFNARADAQGRFHFDSIAPGSYLVTFVHPLLDSLGLEAPVRRIEISRDERSQFVRLAVPSAARLIEALCPARARGDSTSLLLGHVRDAQSLAGLAGASLTLRWSELAIGARGVARSEPSLTVPTNAEGWFAVCNLPVGVDLLASAAHASDTSGVVEVQVPWRGVALREFFVGPSERMVDTIRFDAAGDSARTSTTQPTATDSLSTVFVHWRGAQRFRGRVLASNGRPIEGAEVRLWNTAARARSDAGGAFTLVDVPAGTRTLDVRALGYVRETRPVVVLATSDAPDVSVTMVSVKAYLDTVRVTGRVALNADANGFERRRRSMYGEFLTREDIARKYAPQTSDLMQGMPGVRVVQRGGDNVVLVRGSGAAQCPAEIYVDGMHLTPEMSGLDLFTSPQDIDGIEVYARGVNVPAQFYSNGCGVVVVWTSHVRGRPRLPR